MLSRIRLDVKEIINIVVEVPYVLDGTLSHAKGTRATRLHEVGPARASVIRGLEKASALPRGVGGHAHERRQRWPEVDVRPDASITSRIHRQTGAEHDQRDVHILLEQTVAMTEPSMLSERLTVVPGDHHE